MSANTDRRVIDDLSEMGGDLPTSRITGLDTALAAKADDSTVVHATGDETVSGSLSVSQALPTADVITNALSATQTDTTTADSTSAFNFPFLATFRKDGTSSITGFGGGCIQGQALINAGSITTLDVFVSRGDVATGATIVSLSNYKADSSFFSGGVVTNRYGFHANDISPGTCANQYGLYVESLATGTISNYAVYTAGTTPSYFGGVITANGGLTSGLASITAGGAIAAGDGLTVGPATVTPGGAANFRKDPGAFNAGDFACLVLGDLVNGETDGAVFSVGANDPANRPFTVFGGFDSPTGADAGRFLYFGGGGWGTPDANYVFFFTAPTYDQTTNLGVIRMVINPAGQVLVNPQSFNTPPDADAALSVRPLATTGRGVSVAADAGQAGPLYVGMVDGATVFEVGPSGVITGDGSALKGIKDAYRWGASGVIATGQKPQTHRVDAACAAYQLDVTASAGTVTAQVEQSTDGGSTWTAVDSIALASGLSNTKAISATLAEGTLLRVNYTAASGCSDPLVTLRVRTT